MEDRRNELDPNKNHSYDQCRTSGKRNVALVEHNIHYLECSTTNCTKQLRGPSEGDGKIS